MSTESHPTVVETLSRLWNNLPSLWKAIVPALGALLIVLLPANVLISSRLYSTTTDNLSAQHQNLLSDVGNAFDEFFNQNNAYLTGFASSDAVKVCASSACASASQDVFGTELNRKMHEPGNMLTELGFINLSGQETARATRGSGGIVAIPGDGPLFKTDPDSLNRLDPGQLYVFPVSRDSRIPAVDAYQQPVVRFVVPVLVNDQRIGFVTAVANLDDFFAQNFVYSKTYNTLLLDTNQCLLASSDDTQRPALYKTWTNTPDRTCYPDLQLEAWDTTIQQYHNTILSTRVLHGVLSNSGQTWTIIVQQPTAEAYAQTNTLEALLSLAHLATVGLVILLLVAADRATYQLVQASKMRQMSHARDIRFNPYVVGPPISDKQQFFGRTRSMAEVVGAGVMGGDHVLIDGDRRIGKTSLLRQVEQRLRERRVSDPDYWYWPVSLSLQGVTADVFYATLMEQIVRDVEAPTLHYQSRGPQYGVDDFRDDVNKVLDLPDTGGKQTRLVLCLDNVHFCLDNTLGYDKLFIDTFFDMVDDVGSQLKLIMAGTHIPEDAFDQTITTVTLGPLDPEEAERLIRQPVAEYYAYTEAAIAAILQESDRLPMELQRLARYAVQVMLEQDAPEITMVQVERAIQRAVADWEPTYRLLWNGGADKAGNVVERFSDEVRVSLMELTTRDGPIPASLLAGAKPAVAPSQLGDITYSDADGNLRLMTLFKVWLSRTMR